MKKILVPIFVLCVVLLSISTSHAQKMELSIGSGTHGTGPYLWATVMSQVANEYLTKSLYFLSSHIRICREHGNDWDW